MLSFLDVNPPGTSLFNTRDDFTLASPGNSDAILTFVARWLSMLIFALGVSQRDGSYAAIDISVSLS